MDQQTVITACTGLIEFHDSMKKTDPLLFIHSHTGLIMIVLDAFI